MRILVDVLPSEPEDCIFMEYVEAVSDEVLEGAEICEDCGGVILDDEDVEVVHGCVLSGCRCVLEEGECKYLSEGYVTRF